MRCLLGLSLLIVACGDGDPEQSEHGELALSVENGVAAAVVDGRPISIAEVQTVVDSTGLTPREALDRLVERELLYGEANRRGIGLGRDVGRIREQAMVQAFLEREVEERIPLRSIEHDALLTLYRSDDRFSRPDRRRSTHILFRYEGDDEAIAAGSRRLAERALRELHDAERPEEVAERYQRLDELEGLPVVVEELEPAGPGELYQEPFVEALFSGDGLGPATEVARTTYGWHAILVTEIVVGFEAPWDQVELELRKEVAAERRGALLGELMTTLSQQHRVTVVESAIPIALGVDVGEQPLQTGTR